MNGRAEMWKGNFSCEHYVLRIHCPTSDGGGVDGFFLHSVVFSVCLYSCTDCTVLQSSVCAPVSLASSVIVRGQLASEGTFVHVSIHFQLSA